MKCAPVWKDVSGSLHSITRDTDCKLTCYPLCQDETKLLKMTIGVHSTGILSLKPALSQGVGSRTPMLSFNTDQMNFFKDLASRLSVVTAHRKR